MKFIQKLNRFTPLEFSGFTGIDFKEPKETKFILNAGTLKKVLDDICDKYYILKKNGTGILKCTSEYYDTEDYKLYMAYHNGCGSRYLIKKNEIEGIKNKTIEIKFQSNRGDIVKARQKALDNDFESLKIKEFVKDNTPYNPDVLKKMLKNSFYRIVLIHKVLDEKITIDLDMILSNMQDTVKLPYLAIVEVKQEKDSQVSDFILSLRRLKIQSVSLSKYCIGLALLKNDLKKNNFKSKLLAINKINDSGSYSEHVFSA